MVFAGAGVAEPGQAMCSETAVDECVYELRIGLKARDSSVKHLSYELVR